jgi:hypothetical protein
LCLDEIEAAPDGCLVRSTVADWYRGKSCVVCGREFGEIHQLDHQPALMTPDRRTVLWRDIAAERLDDVLATHGPVCWNCHVAETFRREHPDLVVDRPAHDAHYSGRS